ncbi:hypothetical protein ES703_08310 [subsurface metagenome]
MMGKIGELITENWQLFLSFFIAWVLPFIVVFGAIWLGYYLRSSRNGLKGKATGIQKDTGNDLTLVEILTEMHKQMMHLKAVRLKQPFDKKQFEDAVPLFFDKLGLIKLNDWDTYEKKIAKRIKHRIPKSPERQAKFGWRYKVTSEAQEIVRELVSSREWEIEDGVKAGKHLDSLYIGLGELRDKSEEWQGLFEKMRPYLTDASLRELIDKHISCSYAYCSMLLVINYGSKLPKNGLEQLLFAALSGSNSPTEIDIALYEILEQVEDGLKVFKKGKPFDGEVTDVIRLKLDLGKLLLDGKEILVDLEKMNAQLDSMGVVSAELKFEIWYKDVSETLQNTEYDQLWFENKEGLNYREADTSDYLEICKHGLDRLEYIKQLIFDKEGSQSLGYGIQPIIAEPEISIDVDKCSVSNYGQSDQAIEVALTLKVKSPPINITDLQLYMGDEMLKLLSPAMPITQRNNKECYMTKYQLSLGTIYKVEKDSRDKYHIRVVTKRQEIDSEVFSINNP